ncbi:MAG: hypothetical protein WD989_01340 [Candidatus Paceibacterota bacterium]
MIKKYLMLGIPVIAITVTAFWVARSDFGPLPGEALPEVIIELNEDGFSPKEVAVVRGQKVVFKTTRDKPFWPASDLHPTHGIYPEFDPQEPIEPEKAWSFQLNKAGEWKYHDHLFPYYRGVINVIENGHEAKLDLGDCGDMSADDKKLQCWDELVRNAVSEKGVGYTMRLLSELYKDSQFAVNCHNFAHTIGGEAYFEFKKNNKMDVSLEMNYCGFGFYHGFMETLFAKGESIQVARDLCAYMDEQIGNPLQYAGGACFHGIGHGLVDGSDKKAWGDPQALLKPGLDLCDKVAVTQEEHYRCYSGAFNSISIAYSSKNFGLTIRPEDPLRLCREQKEEYKHACYSDMVVALMDVVSNDLARAVKFIEPIKEDAYAIVSMMNAAGLLARPMAKRGFDFKEVITVCKSVQERLRLACIRGFGAALIEFGKPGEEYVKSLEFCHDPALNVEEKRACLADVLYSLNAIMGAEKMGPICAKVDRQFQDICLSTK